MAKSGFLEHLLQAGKELASQGQNVAERGLGVPGSGPEREAMLSGLGKGALVSGVLGLLLGSKAGRELGSTALTVGGLAALGTVAYKAYQSWQQTQGAESPDPGPPINQLSGEAANSRAIALLRAMIAAARADGQIDEQENSRIQGAISELGLDDATLKLVMEETAQAVDPVAIARGADSPEAAAEIYLASRMVIEPDQWQERAYLAELARALGLAQGLVDQLDAQVDAARA